MDKEANDRFTDMNKYAMNCFQQYIPNNRESLELIEITDGDKSQQLYESFLTIPMYCVKLYKMWFDCRERIEFITKSLSDSIETWQVFEVTCDTLQFTCRRIENWLKEQSTWLVDEPEQINEKLELLQLINDRLEVKFSIDAPKYCDLSSKSLSSCRHEQQRILEFLDESASQVDLLNSTLKRLPNHHHQLCSEESVTLDENNLDNVHIITTTVEMKTDSYDLALNCIKNLMVTFNYLQKITREMSDLWNTRLKLFTEWNSKIQNAETNLSKLCLRMEKIKEQFSFFSEELEKSTIISDENDNNGSFKTIEDNLMLVDDIMKGREVIGAEFTELRSRLCNLSTFMNHNGHNNRQQRMGDLQRNWEELGNNLLNLQRTLEHKTTIWTDLILQVTNIFNWFNEFSGRMKVWHESCPWLSMNTPTELSDILSPNTSKDSSKTSIILNELKRHSKDTSKFLTQCQSNLNLARAQHSKLLYFQSELNSSQRQCTEIQSDAYNQLCSMMNESIETSNQIENHLDTTISIGNKFKTKLNQFTKNYETCLSCINHIKTEFDQSISSIPKCDVLMKSEEENQDVQSLIKLRCLILNNLVEQIGDAKQLNDLLIDTLNEKVGDVSGQVAEKNRNPDQYDQNKDGQNLIQNLEELLKEAIDLDSFYHLDDINKSSSNDVQHYAYCIARYLIYESIQLREMVSHKLITITNETEEQLKLDSMLNYFEQQLTKFQDEMNQIVVNLSAYRSKSFDDNGDTIITSLKSSSLNVDNSTALYWFHLRQSIDNCENRLNQLDNCLQCMIDIGKDHLLKIEQDLNNYYHRTGKLDLKFSHRFNELKSKYEINLNKMRKLKNQFSKEMESWQQFITNLEKAENWLTINESLSKKVLYIVTTDDNKQPDGVHQTITETIHTSCINPNMSEKEIKAANDKEVLSKQLTNLEELEIDLKEHGIELREQTEQSARCLLFNLIPNSVNLIKDKQCRLNRKSEIIDYINLAIENLLNRYNEYKISLQMIHSNLSEKYLCWSKLDSNLEQVNRWLHTIELQLNTMEMETNSLSTILINDISVHKTDEYFAVHQLNAWSNSKLCILTNLMDEMRRYSETELIQLKELVHAQNSIDEVFKEYSKDGNTSDDVVISLGQDASKRLNDILEQHHNLKSRLESLIHLNHVILNLCEKFVRKRCEIFQWLISQRRELEGLINQTETYGSQTSLLSSSHVSLNDEVTKLSKLFHKTTCDLEAFKTSVSIKYEERLTDVIKLIEELGQMTPLRMEPAETYIIDIKRDVIEFFNQVTDKLEHFRVWNDKWSNFSTDCSSLTQWISEQESFIISTLNSQSTIELEDSSFQITSSDVVEKELNQLTSQVDRNRQLRIILIGHQPAMESLVVKAQSLIKSRMFSSSAYVSDVSKSKASDISDKSLFASNMPVGNIAMNMATYIMQRYQTLISICDSRSETSQTAQKMVEELLNSCRNYDHWACEFRIKLSDVDFMLNSYDSHSIPLQESDRYSSIRLSIVDLETRIESGESFVQLIKDWTDHYMTELLVQVNQRRSELETLSRLAKISNENSDHDNELLHCDCKLKSVTSYAETDYQVLKEMVRSLRNRFEKIIQNVNQRSLSRDKFTAWIDTTESQLDLINTHMNLSGLSKIILEAPMDDFDRLIEKVINYMLTASESITQLTVDIRKQGAEIKNSDYTDENLRNRFDQLTESVHSTHQDISSCLKLFHQFQNEVQNFSSWISDCENKFIRLSDGDSNQLAMFLQSNSSIMITNDSDNDTEQIMHQLDISCRSSICQLTEAKHKLLIIKEISSSLENRGHQLNKQLIESGEQLTSKLKILEEFPIGGVQTRSVGEEDVGRSLSTLESSDRLSVIIQNYIDQLQCRLIRLDKIQTVFTINLTELVDCWSDWKNSFDRLIDWLNGTATNLRRPIFHSLDSLSSKQQLANSLKVSHGFSK